MLIIVVTLLFLYFSFFLIHSFIHCSNLQVLRCAVFVYSFRFFVPHTWETYTNRVDQYNILFIFSLLCCSCRCRLPIAVSFLLFSLLFVRSNEIRQTLCLYVIKFNRPLHFMTGLRIVQCFNLGTVSRVSECSTQ